MILDCDVCLCCRVTPKQKAQIVLLVKNNITDTITLAIGDGANDVNMITEADLGLGIRGVEGQQAARSADFSFTEFKCMKRLLFYYGRECYRRNSTMIIYNFFKNIMICFPQWWWGISNLWSGQTLYEKFHYQLFNVVYTFFPIIIYAVLDQELPEKVLLSNPRLYAAGPKKALFNNQRFFTWFLVGAFEALLITGICLYTIDADWTMKNGDTFGFWVFGMTVFVSVAYYSNLKIVTFSNTFSIFSVVFLLGCTLALFVTWAIVGGMFAGNELEGTVGATLGSANFWIIICFVTGMGICDWISVKVWDIWGKKNDTTNTMVNFYIPVGSNSITP
jgi:phospholipid-transporting ATPase